MATGHEKLDEIIARALQAGDGRKRYMSIAIEDENGKDAERLAQAYAHDLKNSGLSNGKVSWIRTSAFNFVGQAEQSLSGVADGGVVIFSDVELIPDMSRREITGALVAAMENRGITALFCGSAAGIRNFLQQDPGLPRRMAETVSALDALPTESVHRDICLMKPIGKIKSRSPKPT